MGRLGKEIKRSLEERTFVTHVNAYSEDHTTRLVFADWLEENGQPERAAFIRDGVALECRIRDKEPDPEPIPEPTPEQAVSGDAKPPPPKKRPPMTKRGKVIPPAKSNSPGRLANYAKKLAERKLTQAIVGQKFFVAIFSVVGDELKLDWEQANFPLDSYAQMVEMLALELTEQLRQAGWKPPTDPTQSSESVEIARIADNTANTVPEEPKFQIIPGNLPVTE